nr:Tyr p 38 allergen [Tyrophagus putrescentiae]
MKFIITFVIFSHVTIGFAMAGGAEIAAAARTQIGLPYSWAGGSWAGKSRGVLSGAHTVGFDCSGLAQYAVYQGTHKKIARVAGAQYADHQCHHVPYAQHQPGDLVFFNDGGSIHHVAVISGHDRMVHAPHTGDHVREAAVYVKGRMDLVTRCW